MYSWIIIVLIQATYYGLLSVCYNVDTQFPIILSKPSESYFGYSTAFHKTTQGKYWLLVGAPRANRSSHRELVQPGVLYKCEIKHNGQCVEVQVDSKGNEANFFRGKEYSELKHNSWFGVSMDTRHDDLVVICAHRVIDQQVYLNSKKKPADPTQDYYVNGVCYSIKRDLDLRTVQTLRPLFEGMQVTNSGHAYFAFGMVGMATHFTDKKNSELLLGAPGVHNWDGNFVVTDNPDKKNYISTSWGPTRSDDESQISFMYFGYAISSGKFFDNDNNVQYLIGAPRYQYVGKIYVVSKSPIGTTIKLWKSGKQLGEYFGAALCATDLNMDGLSEMIVGAPFNAIVKDEGVVYVYVNSKRSGFREPVELRGSEIPGARFGSAITCIKDINRDGYNDFAIGAPYENEYGAVYIYYGTFRDPYFDKQHVQRIEGKMIDRNLRGFGINIAKSRDVDKNEYPDIAVGSYASGHSVILRSRPVVSFEAELVMNPNKISRSAYPCKYQGMPIRCFEVQNCLLYKSPTDIQDLHVVTKMSVDIAHTGESRRGNFFNKTDGSLKSWITDVMTVRHKLSSCNSYQVYIKNDTENYKSPIIVGFDFDIGEKSKPSGDFCSTCPVLDPKSPKFLSNQAIFITGCGNDEFCLSDLKLEASIVYNNIPLENPEVFIGMNNTLTISVTVSNDGEQSFVTELEVIAPYWSNFINPPLNCIIHPSFSTDPVILKCSLANPLLKNEAVSLLLTMDIQELPETSSEIQTNLRVTTGSREEGEKLDNNRKLFKIPVKTRADITIDGSPSTEYFREAKENDQTSGINFYHTFEVRNLGPSPLPFVVAKILIPFQSNDKKVMFVNVTKIQTTDGLQTGYVRECRTDIPVWYLTGDGKPREQIAVPGAVRRRRRSTNIKDKKLSCNSTTCKEVECDIIKISPEESIKVKVEMVFEQSKLKEMKISGDSVDYITEGHVTIRGADPDIQPPDHKPDSTTVKTTFDSGKASKQALAPWILPVSIIAGILLLAIIFGILYKAGFFKRAQRDKLKEIKRASQMVPSDQETSELYNSQNNLIDSQTPASNSKGPE